VIGFATEQHKYNSIRTMDTTVHEMSLGDFEYMFGILAFSAATPEKACDFRIYGLLPEMGEFMAELIVSVFSSHPFLYPTPKPCPLDYY